MFVVDQSIENSNFGNLYLLNDLENQSLPLDKDPHSSWVILIEKLLVEVDPPLATIKETGLFDETSVSIYTKIKIQRKGKY